MIHFYLKSTKKRRCRNIRHMLRGYRFLRESNQLRKLTEIKDELTRSRFQLCEVSASKRFFGSGFNDAEIIVRQYLLSRLAGINLNKALLIAYGIPGKKVVYPLPASWRKVLIKNDVKVDEFKSSLMWFAYISMMFAFGIYSFIKNLFGSINETFSATDNAKISYAYFDNLANRNLPQNCKNGDSYDIITWYKKFSGRSPRLNEFRHSVKGVDEALAYDESVVYMPSPVMSLSGFKNISRYIIANARNILLAGIDLSRGRWWSALLLREASLSEIMRIQPKEKLATDYLFHNSGWIYRPLWTYEAEVKGANIIYYYYSTNCEAFKRKDGYPPLVYGVGIMTWPRYLVWDNYQEDFVRRAVGEGAKIEVVGPIWFSASCKDIIKKDSKYIAVFDVTPTRASIYASLGAEIEYYVPGTVIKFLSDIYQVSQDYDYRILFKQKRKIDDGAHPQYLNFIRKFNEYHNVTCVDPEIPAHRLIESASMVISLPFTSTSIIAKKMRKPSCYYDSVRLVQDDDRAAHGIPVIQSVVSLQTWVEEQADSARSAMI